MLSQLNAYYDAYEKELEELHRKAPATAGLLGMGGHPRDDRCNEIFYYNVEKCVEAFLAEDPGQTEVEPVAEWLLKLGHVHRQDHTYWFCYAIQAHAEKMIPRLSQVKAAELLEWYSDAYPKVDRLPIQRKIFELLRKQAGDRGKGCFGGFWKRKR